MSKHYYAYQFDLPYRPTYLRNWEVPKYYCPKPKRRWGSTTIIANTRGQLLPGVPRPPCNPFGDFVGMYYSRQNRVERLGWNFTGTWAMPRRITREAAEKLNGLAEKRAFMEKCRQTMPRRKFEQNKNTTLKPEPETQAEEVESQEFKKIICPIHDF